MYGTPCSMPYDSLAAANGPLAPFVTSSAGWSTETASAGATKTSPPKSAGVTVALTWSFRRIVLVARSIGRAGSPPGIDHCRLAIELLPLACRRMSRRSRRASAALAVADRGREDLLGRRLPEVADRLAGREQHVRAARGAADAAQPAVDVVADLEQLVVEAVPCARQRRRAGVGGEERSKRRWSSATITAPLRRNEPEMSPSSRMPRERHSPICSNRFRRITSSSAARTKTTRWMYSLVDGQRDVDEHDQAGQHDGRRSLVPAEHVERARSSPAPQTRAPMISRKTDVSVERDVFDEDLLNERRDRQVEVVQPADEPTGRREIEPEIAYSRKVPPASAPMVCATIGRNVALGQPGADAARSATRRRAGTSSATPASRDPAQPTRHRRWRRRPRRPSRPAR